MNKIKLIFKKIKFKLVALFGLFAIAGGCLIFNNNSYAWFVNEDGNLQSSNLWVSTEDVNITSGNVRFHTSKDSSEVQFFGNTLNSSVAYLYYNFFKELEVGKTYTLSIPYFNVLYYDSWINGTHYYTQNGVLTINLTEELKNSDQWRFVVEPNTNSIPSMFGVMVNEGSFAIPYEPYGKVYYNYQFISPWKVNEQGNLESTNLFNASSTEIINDVENNSDVAFQFYSGTSEVYNVGNAFTTNKPAYIYYNVFRNLEVGKTYTLSISNYSYFYYEVWLDDENQYKSNNGILTLNLTEDLKNYDDWRFVITENTSAIFASFTIMINEGTIPFAYAPYGKVYFSSNQAANLQSQLDTLQDKYTLLESNYNDLMADYENAHMDLDIANSQLNEYLDTIHQLNNDVVTLQQLVNSLRSQVGDNFTWQNLFFTMADTPFRVVANALGFNIFGINLFATFIGLTTTLAIIFLVKKFI